MSQESLREQERTVEHKYQWSLFTSQREQLVVRCNNWQEFLEAINQMRSLLPQEEESTPEEEKKEPENTSRDFCAMHNKHMKERTGKNGQTWFDHRYQVEKDGKQVWVLCNGKYEKVQNSG